MADYEGETISIGYFLLPSKKCEVYKKCLELLKKKAPNLRPQKVITDYEMAMINASEWAFPTSCVQGCFFHYCESCWRYVQTNGMKKMYGKEEVKELISESMALALLPEHLIEPVFDLLREKFRSEPSLTISHHA